MSIGIATIGDREIGVIGQKTVSDDRVEQWIAKLGGTITQDLSIVNAFAAQMKAKDVPQLAQANGVKWVSFDAPIVQTACKPPCIDTTKLKSIYPQAVNAPSVWNVNGQYWQGQVIAVAVVDSGINANHPDLLEGRREMKHYPCVPVVFEKLTR